MIVNCVGADVSSGVSAGAGVEVGVGTPVEFWEVGLGLWVGGGVVGIVEGASVKVGLIDTDGETLGCKLLVGNGVSLGDALG